MMRVQVHHTVRIVLLKVVLEQRDVYLFFLQVANDEVCAPHPQLLVEIEGGSQVVLKVLLPLRPNEELFDAVHDAQLTEYLNC